MTATVNPPSFVSEIFPLSRTELNLLCFQLTPALDRQLGNRFSWRFTQKLSNYMAVIWHNDCFWVLGKPQQLMPSQAEQEKVLAQVQEDLRADIGDECYKLVAVSAQITADILAELAVRILQRFCQFDSPTVWAKNQVEVRREVQFWAETIETMPEFSQAALALTVHSSFLYSSDLQQFYTSHPQQQDAQELLQGLKEFSKG